MTVENSNQNSSIAVIGAGSWGTALAILLANNGLSVNLWGRNPQQIEDLCSSRENKKYLPGIKLPDLLSPHSDLSACLQGIENILLVIPSNGFSDIVKQIKPFVNSTTKVALASKGLHPTTLKPLHEVIIEELGQPTDISVISGPTFAMEVARGLPTAVTIASDNPNSAKTFATLLSNEHFRAYTSDDVIGVEVGGTVKNVMAIAAGISDGLGFGANARAALITRGLAEITRLGVRLNGKKDTFMGLAGLGDLILTCTDNQSRNRRVGLGLAKNKSIEQILEELGQVAEGVMTTEKVYHLTKKLNIEMPIVEQVYSVIYQGKPPSQAVHDLLKREIRSETL